MSLQSNTNNDIFIVPSQSLMQFSGSSGNTITLQVEPSGAVNFVGTTGSILKIMDNLSGSLFSVNNISGLSLFEVFSYNQIKIGNPTNYALIVSGSNVIITGSLVDKSTGVKFLVVDTTTGVVYTTGSGGGGGSSTTPGGSHTQIQYNSASTFQGVPNLTYSSSFGLIATGSFTGSFTGSLLGTASWASSASQAITASYINITSTNTSTLTVNTATPGEIKLTAITGSNSSVGSTGQLQYNAGSGTFGAVASSSFSGNQLTLGNLIATGSLRGTATTASYVNLQAGPRIQAINYNTSSGAFTITGSIGGSDKQIQFNSGSAFSGSNNFTFNYTNNTARVSGSLNITGSTILSSSLMVIGTTSLTGSLTVTGSTVLSGSFDNVVSQNSDYVASVVNTNLTTAASAEFLIRGGNGISGSSFYIQSTPKGWLTNPYYPGSVLMVAVPSNFAGDATRPMKFISMIAGTPAASTFEWHYRSSAFVDQTSLKMKLDVPSGTLSNSGSIITSGSLIVASDSTYASTTAHEAIYFGTPGVVGSWRIALSGSALVIEKWPLVGSAYSRSATFT